MSTTPLILPFFFIPRDALLPLLRIVAEGRTDRQEQMKLPQAGVAAAAIPRLVEGILAGGGVPAGEHRVRSPLPLGTSAVAATNPATSSTTAPP